MSCKWRDKFGSVTVLTNLWTNVTISIASILFSYIRSHVYIFHSLSVLSLYTHYTQQLSHIYNCRHRREKAFILSFSHKRTYVWDVLMLWNDLSRSKASEHYKIYFYCVFNVTVVVDVVSFELIEPISSDLLASFKCERTKDVAQLFAQDVNGCVRDGCIANVEF